MDVDNENTPVVTTEYFAKLASKSKNSMVVPGMIIAACIAGIILLAIFVIGKYKPEITPYDTSYTIRENKDNYDVDQGLIWGFVGFLGLYIGVALFIIYKDYKDYKNNRMPSHMKN